MAIHLELCALMKWTKYSFLFWKMWYKGKNRTFQNHNKTLFEQKNLFSKRKLPMNRHKLVCVENWTALSFRRHSIDWFGFLVGCFRNFQCLHFLSINSRKNGIFLKSFLRYEYFWETYFGSFSHCSKTNEKTTKSTIICLHVSYIRFFRFNLYHCLGNSFICIIYTYCMLCKYVKYSNLWAVDLFTFTLCLAQRSTLFRRFALFLHHTECQRQNTPKTFQSIWCVCYAKARE